MSSLTGLSFLRPYLASELRFVPSFAYLRFYHSTGRRLGRKPSQPKTLAKKLKPASSPAEEVRQSRYDVEERIKELRGTGGLLYPRIDEHNSVMTISKLKECYNAINTPEPPLEIVTLRGRVSSTRHSGKGLAFMDFYQDGDSVQGTCNSHILNSYSGCTPAEFQQFFRLLRRGDIISITGKPYLSKAGSLSVSAIELPMILSPSLASLPTSLMSPETRMRNRHVDIIVNNKTAHTLRARSHIIQQIRKYLLDLNFLEVQTPILGSHSGGAIAKPFTTMATNINLKELSLRIAPEIWLKRLIIGGMDRVFEIGPSFRNEGLDLTHNPEFTTCEFYRSFANLEDLIGMTQEMILSLVKLIDSLRATTLYSLPELDPSFQSTSYKRLPFIPTIEDKLGEKLPDLAADDATEQLLELFTKHEIKVPKSPTLPRLLDMLASVYIEPDCILPTFITHHPACMAPLSKSFIDRATKQEVSARAELFIQGKEIANMYEEENSPFEQRKKFVQQIRFKDHENEAVIDESYLEALEWGLPPTGGWGCGIDRLIMMLTGSNRISDVLAFGTLKNVVNLGNTKPVAAVEGGEVTEEAVKDGKEAERQ